MKTIPIRIKTIRRPMMKQNISTQTGNSMEKETNNDQTFPTETEISSEHILRSKVRKMSRRIELRTVK